METGVARQDDRPRGLPGSVSRQRLGAIEPLAAPDGRRRSRTSDHGRHRPNHTLDDPLAPRPAPKRREATHRSARFYEDSIELGRELLERPKRGGGPDRVRVQHAKGRMTVWERIEVLTDQRAQPASARTGAEPRRRLDRHRHPQDRRPRRRALRPRLHGARRLDGRDQRRASSRDLIYLAGERGIPLIGMNDSAGAFVPAGVGGLDGYAEAFTALRKISGVVPSIMCMFGYNAGGGSYLPRQGCS